MLIFDNQLVGPWVADKTGCPLCNKMATIGWLNSDGHLTGGLIYDHYTGESVVGTVAVDGFVPKQFMEAMFDYPFNQLGVKTLIAYVEEGNLPSIRFLERVGFTRCTTVPGVYEDGAMHIYTMKREQCRWIGDRDGQEVQDAKSA